MWACQLLSLNVENYETVSFKAISTYTLKQYFILIHKWVKPPRKGKGQFYVDLFWTSTNPPKLPALFKGKKWFPFNIEYIKYVFLYFFLLLP